MLNPPLVISLALIIALPSVGGAEEPALPDRAGGGQGDGAQVSVSSKSPATAVLLSLGSTAGTVSLGIGLVGLGQNVVPGLATIALGVVLGPSMGHFYAGEVGHGLGTAGLRLGLGLLGSLMVTGGIVADLDCEGEAGACGGGRGLLIGGVTLWVGVGALVLYDLIDAGFAARRANRSRQVAVKPLIGADGRLYGVGLAGTF